MLAIDGRRGFPDPTRPGWEMEPFAGTTAVAGKERAVSAARAVYGRGWRPDRLAIAPGRIELLGNHLDYNGGPVLAAAIDRFVVVAAADDPAAAHALRAVAADVADGQMAVVREAEMADWRNPSPPPRTFDYVRGMLAAVRARAALRPRLPASIAIAGDVPIGFGVSSSAALCVGLAMALADGFSSPKGIVLLAQEAEHRAGAPCGTMDQSASVAGGAISFDGATLAVERLAPELGQLVFAIADSGVERSLGASSYPRRVAEAREALEIARRELRRPVPSLASLTVEQLQTLLRRGALWGALARRTQHIVDETARVRAGREAMIGGEWEQFGRLMTESGRSSATLYQISHPRVEELVGEALRVEGVLGARMMGGGEGGSALILLRRASVEALERQLRAGYYRRHGLDTRADLVHVCAFAPGAAVVPYAE